MASGPITAIRAPRDSGSRALSFFNSTIDLPAAARALTRAASETAVALGAQTLIDDIEALARRARISLDAPVAPVLGETDALRMGLTSRETEVLALVAVGKTNREIGTQLYVSEKTASVHVSNILRKLGVSSRVDAAAIAQRVGVA